MSGHVIQLSGGPADGQQWTVTDATFEAGYLTTITSTQPPAPLTAGEYVKPADGDGPWVWEANTGRKLQDRIEHEMAYTAYTDSCQDAHITPEGELRECRRSKRHAPPHASGYRDRHRQWFDKP
jgi:hypothetical protein